MWTEVMVRLVMVLCTIKWQYKLEKLICILMCSSRTIHYTFVCSGFMLTHGHLNLWRPLPTRSRTGGKNPLRTACVFRTGPAGGTASGWRRTARGCSAAAQWAGSSTVDLWDYPSGWGRRALHTRFWHRRLSSLLDVAAVAPQARIISENNSHNDIITKSLHLWYTQ